MNKHVMTMDCKQARQLLDLIPAGEPLSAPEEYEAAVHLEGCRTCQTVVGNRRAIDVRLHAALHNVEVPGGLLERLLENIDQQGSLAPQTAQPRESTPSRRRVVWSALVGALLAGCVLLSAFFWNGSQPPSDAMAFSQVQRQLEALFGTPGEQTWATLPPVDRSLHVGHLDGSLRRLKLIDAKGVHLDEVKGEDAVAYRFRNSRGTGIVVVLPAVRLSEVPQNVVPSPGSKKSFVWRSNSGDEVYVCFVHQGRPEELMNLMFPTA